MIAILQHQERQGSSAPFTSENVASVFRSSVPHTSIPAATTGLSTEEYPQGYSVENTARMDGDPTQPKIRGEHTSFLTQFVDEHPAAILDDINDALTEEFPDVTISLWGLAKHREKCALTLKRAMKYLERRNDPNPARIVVPATRRPSMSLLAAISKDGIVEASFKLQKVKQPVSTSFIGSPGGPRITRMESCL
ncbi:hypothetical protein VTP01DRAFT_9489 [Rhizomucor pusillus]|uniref:uncharacterized protein n=1 Tax=Rhizomucor pusillus TaxID=4840 RepID=UPI003743C3B9